MIKNQVKYKDQRMIFLQQKEEFYCSRKRNFIVVERGIANKEFFYIPKDLVENFDGDTVHFKISEDEIEEKYTNKDNIFKRESLK